MIEKLYIEATSTTPRIVLDKEAQKFLISGRSLPEDAENAYAEVMDWLERYKADPNPQTDLTVNLDYYNSSSLRKIADIMLTLKDIGESTGTAVSVKWYYEEGDDSSMENAEDLRFACNIPFEIIEIS